MSKGERISQFVEELTGASPDAAPGEIARHPCYVGFFRCWNEQRYYEAHDVLEHLWLSTTGEDGDYFKGLIQAAGAFVHLQKQFARPLHPKDGRRLHPAVRLFRLAEENLSRYKPVRHEFDVAALCRLLHERSAAIVASDFTMNPWSPDSAPKLALIGAC
jgi:hypothetical protein